MELFLQKAVCPQGIHLILKMENSTSYFIYALSYLFLAAFVAFLLFGFLKGIFAEKEMRLRKRRKYS